MDLSRSQIVTMLRRAGLPDLANAAQRELPEQVSTSALNLFCTAHNITRGALMDRMGGSP